MKRKLLLSVMAAATAVITFCGALQPADAQQQQKPNILFIMGDDIGLFQPTLRLSAKRQLEMSLSSQQQLHHLLRSGSPEQRAATGELDRYSRQ